MEAGEAGERAITRKAGAQRSAEGSRGSLRTPEDGFNLQLESGPHAAASARQALRRLRNGFDEDLKDTMRLLLTELVANSVRHAESNTVSVQAVVTGSSIWFEVADEGPGFDRHEAMREGAHSDESGWGLFLVERLANRWGVRHDGGATYVWFELQR